MYNSPIGPPHIVLRDLSEEDFTKRLEQARKEQEEFKKWLDAEQRLAQERMYIPMFKMAC